MASELPIPAKLIQYTEDPKLTAYFKQLHDKIEEFERRIEALENP